MSLVVSWEFEYYQYYELNRLCLLGSDQATGEHLVVYHLRSLLLKQEMIDTIALTDIMSFMARSGGAEAGL